MKVADFKDLKCLKREMSKAANVKSDEYQKCNTREAEGLAESNRE